MSSETSTDAAPVAPPRPSSTSDQGLQPWQLFTLAGLISAAIVAFRAGDRAPSVRIALILTIFAAAAVGIAALRALAPLTGSQKPDATPTIGNRTRAALEREKTLSLRTLKELEFDRAMGKISEKDFAEMSARLRARAARILRQLDEATGYRAEIERDVARRIERVQPAAPAPVPTPADAAPILPAPPARLALICGACQTGNDPDARFCKGCGARLEVA